MNETLLVFLPDAEATVRLGYCLAKHYPGRLLLCLRGPLGAGKTSLVKGVAAGFDIDGVVTSPTFTMLNEYEGEHKVLYHFDLYRLGEDLKFAGLSQPDGDAGIIDNELVWEIVEILQLGSPVAVEWPEFSEDLFSRYDRFDLEIRYLSTGSGLANGRQVTIRAFGSGPLSFLPALADKLSQENLAVQPRAVDENEAPGA